MKLKDLVLEDMRRNKLSQAEIADKIGIAQGSVSNILNGRLISRRMIKKVADYYKKAPGSFIEFDDFQEEIPPDELKKGTSEEKPSAFGVNPVVVAAMTDAEFLRLPVEEQVTLIYRMMRQRSGDAHEPE